MKFSPWLVFIVIVVLIASSLTLYHTLNTNFWGHAAVDFSEITFSKNMQRVSDNKSDWSISYETNRKIFFVGTIRHISPIRMEKFPFLTHDILVTSGDFANPDLVKTSVINHMFTWRSKNTNQPHGRINLLHTVPINEELYDFLWTLKKNQQVSIQGYEILKITALDAQGNSIGWWEDHGCNTILITEIVLE